MCFCFIWVFIVWLMCSVFWRTYGRLDNINVQLQTRGVAGVIRYTLLSQNFPFAVLLLEKRFIYDDETRCSFVYLMVSIDKI